MGWKSSEYCAAAISYRIGLKAITVPVTLLPVTEPAKKENTDPLGHSWSPTISCCLNCMYSREWVKAVNKTCDTLKKESDMFYANQDKIRNTKK